MATSAFKSTTKRTPIAKSSTSNEHSSSSNRTTSAHRRSRSLSRFSRRLLEPSADDFSDETPAPPPKGRFVNTVRGSGFPEISLDDLAIEFFDSRDGGGGTDRGRSAKRGDDVSDGSGGESLAQRRGRSQGPRGSAGNFSGGGRVNSESNSRRRRSVSVVRCQISDSEVKFCF